MSSSGRPVINSGEAWQRVGATSRFTAAQGAYRAYIDHVRDCPVCRVNSSVCTTAGALWAAYLEAHEQ